MKFQFYVCAHYRSVYFGAALSVLPDSVSIVTATEHFPAVMDSKLTETP